MYTFFCAGGLTSRHFRRGTVFISRFNFLHPDRADRLFPTLYNVTPYLLTIDVLMICARHANRRRRTRGFSVVYLLVIPTARMFLLSMRTSSWYTDNYTLDRCRCAILRHSIQEFVSAN
ncbi:hypothetical protein F4680DRAFT_39124 [Xylaria scruposa]|nr:hypothetical protein F4680DRAFT_39124 [Xylaria scruposa]